ncbi:hypothetical protein TESG_08199 [Trichophyton tonsurans CBS 112818]|uniref:Uncharacterized protein n=1 Tax=Trichophyton tonsurans (strain CBS 112818) TaxID=647933 RepID=F2SBG1_TRIT1|nr:hypothetical protein TESG_08199 [Trichophyton tonsurans CBS 112818]
MEGMRPLLDSSAVDFVPKPQRCRDRTPTMNQMSYHSAIPSKYLLGDAWSSKGLIGAGLLSSIREEDHTSCTVSCKSNYRPLLANTKHSTKLLSLLTKDDKVFRMPYTVRTGKSEYPLVREMVQADQGSDLNVISLPLAETLGLDIRPLAECLGGRYYFRGLIVSAPILKGTPHYKA